MYLPKSQYIIKNTTGGEFSLNGSNYVGPYIKTYRSQFFAGNELGPNMQQLTPVQQEVTPSIELFINYYPQPTEQDYERGFFTRYFVQAKSSKKVLEVRKNQFDTVSTRSYNREAITWELTGSRLTQFPVAQRSNAAVLVNAETLRSLEERFPGVSEFVFDDQFVR